MCPKESEFCLGKLALAELSVKLVLAPSLKSTSHVDIMFLSSLAKDQDIIQI